MSIGIAVIGNSSRNAGAPMAGDLALGGHDVRLALEADQRDCLEAVRSAGGITLTPPASQTLVPRQNLIRQRWPSDCRHATAR